MKVSFIVPAYNEEAIALKAIKELRDFLKKFNGIEFEIVVVNDGSTDKTAEIVGRIPEIKLINHLYNKGYGASLKTGILAAQFDRILIIDADGTYPFEKIADLIRESDEYEMVVGARTGPVVHQSIAKKIGKWPINQLANYLVGFKIPDLNSGLRIFRKDLAVKYFHLLPNGFSFTTNITLAFLSDGYNVKYIPINYHKRIGKSKVRPVRDALNYFVLVMRMILFYNPLKVFIPLAILFFVAALSSFIYDIWFLGNLTEKSIIFFVGFVQITIMGFLADLINKRNAHG